MWELPTWYGTCLVCMILATLVSLICEPHPYKSAALMYCSILNLNAIALLFALCLPAEEEVDDDTNSESEQIQDGQEEASTTSEENPSEQQDPSSNFVALDENPCHFPNKHNDKWFSCFCSKFSYPCFFILTVLLSINVSFATFPRHYGQDVIHFSGWESALFLITHGALLLSSVISWIQRGYLKCNFGFQFSFTSKREGDGHDEKLLQMRNNQVSRRAVMLVSGLLGAICFTIAGLGYREVTTNLDNINSFSDANNGVYTGEAHVSGYTLLDVVDDDDESWCSAMDDSIPVNVTVAWGGAWGCPNSGAYCESEVTTQVSCAYDERDDEDASDDDQYQVTTLQTPNEYVNYRYHEYHNGDDDAYDQYAFDYDLDTQPEYQSWTRPSDCIYGDCGTCEARSSMWMMEQENLVSSKLHFGSMLVGMGLVFVGWPLMSLFAFGDQGDISTSQQNLEVV
jgi:hypothetical protein